MGVLDGVRGLGHVDAAITDVRATRLPVAAPTEVLGDPHVAENGYRASRPDHASARLASGPRQFDDTRLVVRHGAPTIGQHTNAILAEAGLAADEIARLHQIGAIT